MTEIHDLAQLDVWLASGVPLTGLRLQGLDLRGYDEVLSRRVDVVGLAVLGGQLPTRLAGHLLSHGAVVFPTVPKAPIDPYRARLYQPAELYAGLAQGYSATPDARAYRWSQDASLARDALVTAVRALHDDAMSDALTEVLDGLPAVGVMGGHGLLRGSPGYAQAARLGQLLARSGRVVLTGGGPGAMEAANLGAYAVGAGHADALDDALVELARVPSFTDVSAWAGVALRVRQHLEAGVVQRGPLTSIGVPTWFYGHEPSNVFCQGIAKYFSNALREDVLLSRASDGVIVLPGAAGTVQEIFQAVTPRYYASGEAPPAALVLLGREHWTVQVPVWPLLTVLAQGRAFADRLYLVDSPEEAVAHLTS